MVSSYKTITATAQVYSGATQLYGAVLTASSDTATVSIKDGTSTTGAIIAKLSAVANTSVPIMFTRPISVLVGIYATLTGTTPSVSFFTDGYYASTSSSTSTTTTSSSTSTTSTSTTTTSTSTTSTSTSTTSTSTTTINEETP